MDNKILELLLNVKEDQTEIKVNIGDIRKDLSYHIKRTDLLEMELLNHRANVNIHRKHLTIKTIVSFLTGISLSLGIIYSFIKVVIWLTSRSL